MKAVLVQPPVLWTTTPPLGLAYLAGELLAAGDEVEILDANIELHSRDREAYGRLASLAREYGQESPLRRLFPAALAARLAECRPSAWKDLERHAEGWALRVLSAAPDLVGVSLHAESLLAGLALARASRRLAGLASPLLVAGGPEAIFLRKGRPEAIEDGLPAGRLFDAVVVGEGEGPLREIAARWRLGRSLGDRPIPGAVFLGESGRKVDPAGAPGDALVAIDGIAFPSFAGLPLDRYGFPGMLPILGSRGCPARCTFCFETAMWGRFRTRDPARVVEEMRLRLEEHGPGTSFRFNDSLLNGDLDWLARFTDLALAEGLDAKWHGNARVHPGMTRLYLEKLARAGLTGLLYGVESGSERILRRMKKGVRAADIPRVLDDTYGAGIWTHAFLIFGFPGEGVADLLETLDLVLERLDRLDSVAVHDFHLAEELVEYLDFHGRVPMDGSRLAPGRPNLAGLGAYLDVFLGNFLRFSRAHAHVHYIRRPPDHCRALLDLYRARWRGSREFARARVALALLRELLAIPPERRGDPELTRLFGIPAPVLSEAVAVLASRFGAEGPRPAGMELLAALASVLDSPLSAGSGALATQALEGFA